MIAYCIGVLPLIRDIREAHPLHHPTMLRGRCRGRGNLQAHSGTLPGPTEEGDTKGLITGSNQEYLGHGPKECGKGRVVLPWDGDDDRYWESVTWGFCWR